ncbi:MAG: cellulase family glycosylhydrolase [Armatimonadota bacterium]
MPLDYSKIRGFNYQPGYAGSLAELWISFDPAYWEREVPWALRFDANMLRVWLDWHAYIAIGDRLLDELDTALAILAKHGLRMMPVLFNRWNDNTYPMGMVTDHDLLQSNFAFDKFIPYVDALGKRFGNDERIAIWDLCNEPGAPWHNAEMNLRESAWLSRVADRLRRHTVIPLTIGTMSNDNVRLYAPLVDVISFHPYPGFGEMEKSCKDHLEIAAGYGKPLICTETCKGSLDDQERGTLARENIETLEAYGIGWLAWQLCATRFITGARERTDSNAVRPGEGYMPFVLADGTTRPGHEWLEARASHRI